MWPSVPVASTLDHVRGLRGDFKSQILWWKIAVLPFVLGHATRGGVSTWVHASCNHTTPPNKRRDTVSLPCLVGANIQHVPMRWHVLASRRCR